MSQQSGQSRRRFLLRTGGAVGSAVTLAGCLGTGDDDKASSDQTFPGEAAEIDDHQRGPDRDSDVPPAAHEHLLTATAYDGTINDRTGEETVIVSVGAGADGLDFSPVAIRIEPGTTVEWRWSGVGGDHNVVATPDSTRTFDSGDPVDSAETAFSQTFVTPGLTLYWCTPHREAGMRGAVHVVE